MTHAHSRDRRLCWSTYSIFLEPTETWHDRGCVGTKSKGPVRACRIPHTSRSVAPIAPESHSQGREASAAELGDKVRPGVIVSYTNPSVVIYRPACEANRGTKHPPLQWRSSNPLGAVSRQGSRILRPATGYKAATRSAMTSLLRISYSASIADL